MALALTLPFALYFGAAEGFMRFPMNGDADPGEGEIDVFLVSNGVHVDVWVPSRRPEKDWATWFPRDLPVDPRGYVSFGWGDEQFFLNVPTWDDLTVGVALSGTFLPTRSAMQVKAWDGVPYSGDRVHRLRIGTREYTRLVAYLESGFELDADGHPALLDQPGYRANDRFFAGSGDYHLFRTCNVWTNGAVKAMGQRAPLWAPLERHVRHQLPKNQGKLPGE